MKHIQYPDISQMFRKQNGFFQKILHFINNHPKTAIPLALIIFLSFCAKFEINDWTEDCFRVLDTALCYYSGNCTNFANL